MQSVKLVAIVSSFNRKRLLVDAIQSLFDCLPRLEMQCAIVVFDAGSTDGSIELLQQLAESSPMGLSMRLIVPQPGDDTSFSAGVNAATRVALDAFPDCEFLFLFETDNLLRSEKSVAAGIHLLRLVPEMGAVGFTVTKRDGRPAGFGCAFPTPLQFACGTHLCLMFGMGSPTLDWQSTGGVEFAFYDVVYTSPLLVRLKSWVTTSGFDSETFPFSDCDVDWAWRMRKSGWRMAVLKCDDVIHDNEQQISVWSTDRALHFHRARLKFFQRITDSALPELKVFLFLRHCLEYAFLMLLVACGRKNASLLNPRAQLIKTVFRGYEIETSRIDNEAKGD